jgi:D-glycero-D-manno-heptose 1,7-bisphosphate phosphatase
MAAAAVRLVILDRDGVINRESPAFVRSPAQWHPLPGSLEAIARLYHAGWTVAVATNQSGVGRGLLTLQTLEQIHARMAEALAAHGARLAQIAYCPHLPEEGCACRKPRPGLLYEIAARQGVSLANVPVIGDSLRDLEAARAAGARPMLVRSGNGAYTEASLPPDWRVAVVDDLSAAADLLLAECADGATADAAQPRGTPTKAKDP